MTTDENSRALWNDDGAGGLCNRSDNVTLPTDAVNKKYTHIVDKFDAFAVFFMSEIVRVTQKVCWI